MKKNILLLVLCTIVLTTSAEAGGWHKSIAAAQAEAKKKNQLIFVDLFAQWCGWCHRMEREVFPAEPFQKATAQMVLLRVDTEDRGEGSRLAREYQIRSLPTFLLITPDGMLAGMIYGYAPADQLAQRLAEVKGKYDSFLKEVKSEPAFAKDYKRRLALAIDFIGRRGYAHADTRLASLVKQAPKGIADDAAYHLALSQYAQLKHADSVKTLQQLFARKPQGEPLERGRFLLGQVYFDQGNYKAAASELRQFKKSYPKSALMPNVDALLPQAERAAAMR